MDAKLVLAASFTAGCFALGCAPLETKRRPSAFVFAARCSRRVFASCGIALHHYNFIDLQLITCVFNMTDANAFPPSKALLLPQEPSGAGRRIKTQAPPFAGFLSLMSGVCLLHAVLWCRFATFDLPPSGSFSSSLPPPLLPGHASLPMSRVKKKPSLPFVESFSPPLQSLRAVCGSLFLLQGLPWGSDPSAPFPVMCPSGLTKTAFLPDAGGGGGSGFATARKKLKGKKHTHMPI